MIVQNKEHIHSLNEYLANLGYQFEYSNTSPLNLYAIDVWICSVLEGMPHAELEVTLDGVSVPILNVITYRVG